MDNKKVIKLSEADVLASVELKIEDGVFLHVWVWETVEKMQEHTKLEGNYLACFISPQKWNKIAFGGLINLVVGEFGGGIFAHELQHFIQYWIDINELEPANGDWEIVAHLAGDLTCDFYTWFWENFTEVTVG